MMYLWFSPTIVELTNQPKQHKAVRYGARHSESEHKYNLIVSGIDESPKGSPCHKCIINKTQSVAIILHLLNPEINDQFMQNYQN